MKTYFKYSILSYSHSQLLDEKLNVGILFYFPNSSEEKLIFRFPHKLSRLRGFYHDFSEWQLRNYLRSFDFKTNEINLRFHEHKLNFHIKDDLSKIIHDEYIKPDATVLEFSEVRTGKVFDDIYGIIEKYFNLYFSVYTDPNSDVEKHDEHYVLQNVKKIFYQKNSSVLHKLIPNRLIENETTNCKFDYSWQNGTTNLIKSLSFDLKDKNDITHKAILWKGIFEQLKEINYRFDLLIAHPQNNKPRENFKEYDKALKILDSIVAQKTIVIENSFEKYVDEVIETITSHSGDDVVDDLPF